MSLKDVSPAAEPSVAQALSTADPEVLDSRRRPGRSAHVSQHLLSLLRDPASAEIPAPSPGAVEVQSFREDLPIAKGLGVGLLLSIPAWTAIGLATWAMLR